MGGYFFELNLVFRAGVEPRGPGTRLTAADCLILASETKQIEAVLCFASVIRRRLVFRCDPCCQKIML